MKTEHKNRIDAYHGVNIMKKQYENCLLPLYKCGSGTTKDIVGYIKEPINRVSGRFSECRGKGFIEPNPTDSSKIQDGRKSTDYILTPKGREIVDKVQSNIQSETLIEDNINKIFEPLLDVFGGHRARF